MLKALRPSSWGLKVIDVIVAFLIIALVVKLIAPTSGLGVGISTLCHWLAIGLTYLAGLLAQFLTWL